MRFALCAMRLFVSQTLKEFPSHQLFLQLSVKLEKKTLIFRSALFIFENIYHKSMDRKNQRT